MQQSKTRLVFIFFVALSLRWVYALRFPANALLADIDASGYHQIAVNILDGRGFSMNWEVPYLPDTLRTPAYPLFIASVYVILGRNTIAVAIVQGVMDACTCLILSALVRNLTKSEFAALVAGLLYALNPTAWRFSDSLLTETALAFAITWFVLVFSQITDLAKSPPIPIQKTLTLGLLCGLATLIKPNALLLPIFTILCLAIWPGKSLRLWLTQSAVIIAASMLVIFPWCIRNWMIVGRPILSSAFDDNLSHISAVATLIHAQGEVVAPWTPRWEEFYGTIIAEAARRYSWSPAPFQSAREADERQQQLAAVAREIIRQHPADFALSHINGFLRSWVPQEHRFWYEFISGQSWNALHTAEGVAGQIIQLIKESGISTAIYFLWRERFAKLPPLAFVIWAGWNLSYLLSAILLWKGSWRLRKNPAFVCLVWSSVFYFTFLPGPISYVRFRVPVAPLLIAIITVGIAN